MTINIDAAWLAARTPPYLLTTAGTYVLQADVTTLGTAFKITLVNGIVLELNGHKITYDNAPPIVLTNPGFETGDFAGWDVSHAPAAVIAPATVPGMYGQWMLRLPGITTPQTVISGPIAIPQAGIPYIAGIQCHAASWGNTTSTLSVIDTVTKAVLGTPFKIDPGGGPILKVAFVPQTTNPVVLRVDIVVAAGKTATVDLDYACLYRTGIYGVWVDYNKAASIVNGTIIQGQGHSAISPAVYAPQVNLTLDGVTAYASGMDTSIIFNNFSAGASIKNCNIKGGLDQISNRMAANAEIYLFAATGIIDVEDNHLSGSHQNGIVISGLGAGTISKILVGGNDIRLDSNWTDGYGIGIGGWCRNFEVANNVIRPVSGRGIIVDTNNKPIDGGSIHDNEVVVQERGNLEYGQMGLCVVGLRLRNWTSRISNLDIYNNTFAAYTGIGPGIPPHADYAAAGGRLTLLNDKGQQKDCNITVRDNLFKAIVMASDPGISYNVAYGFSFPQFDAGMGVKFINNTCESNSVALNFGDGDGINEYDITMIGTSVVKSTEGQAMPFTSIMVGNWGGVTHDVRMIDTAFVGGAPATPTFVGTAAKDISFGHMLTVEVVDGSNMPQAGAVVMALDAAGGDGFGGTTDAAGVFLAPVPLVRYAVSANSKNIPVITSTPQPLTVSVTTGAGMGSGSVTMTGPATLTITTDGGLAPAEGSCVLDGSGDLAAEGVASWPAAEGACVLDGAGDLAGEGRARWRFLVYDPVPY